MGPSQAVPAGQFCPRVSQLTHPRLYLLGTASPLCRCPRRVPRVPGPQAVLLRALLQLRELLGQPGQPGPHGHHVLLSGPKDSLDLWAQRSP